jgi:predicted MPP superfamily phosphohydrolase
MNPMRPRANRRLIRVLLAVNAFAALLLLYAVFVERYWIAVNHYRVAVPHLPEAFRGFRIVQVTDVHYGRLVPRWYVRRAVELANRQRADLIVGTGDYVHARRAPAEVEAAWPLLQPLQAPCGVYAVLGNHDHWASTACSRRWAVNFGWNVEHRVVPITRQGATFWLAGAGDLWTDSGPLDPVLAQIPADGCRIVLAHNPDTVDGAFTNRVDLFICGHTHGGQVRLPFLGALRLPVRNPAYSSGLCRSPRGVRVFISRGLGWAIYPVRFNCRPEIAVLELVPE